MKGIEALATSSSSKPTALASIRYLFFTMGISEAELNKCTIPYILEVVATHGYIEKEKLKAEKKARRKSK